MYRGFKMIKEISTEHDLIDYMYKNYENYFEFHIVASEVKFRNSLKAVDLLGEDRNYYYIIEVKAQLITEEDFCNLKYIIMNNCYDRPFKGLLIGTSISNYLLELIEKEDNIDYMIPKNIRYNKNVSFISNSPVYIIKSNRYYNNLKNFFRCSSGGNIEEIYNKSDCLKIKLSNGKYLIVNDYYYDLLSNNGHWAFHEEECIYVKESKCSLGGIERKMFRDSSSFVFYKGTLIKNNEKLKQCNDFSLFLEIMLRYINMNTIAKRLKQNLIVTNDREGIGLHLEMYQKDKKCSCCIIPLRYKHLKEKIITYIINDLKKYNYINVIELTRITINGRLYKPIIKIIYDNNFTVLELIVKLTNGKFVSKKYKSKIIDGIISNEFYLLCDIDITLDFEDYVSSFVNRKIKIDSQYEDLVNYHLIKRYKEKNMKDNNMIKTIRDIINEFTDEERAEIELLKDVDCRDYYNEYTGYVKG